MPNKTEYTHHERAVNFAMQFANITNESQITNLAKQALIVALNRNIGNLIIMAAWLEESNVYSEEILTFIHQLLEDEKLLLNAAENL